MGLFITLTYMKRRNEARRSMMLYFSGVPAASSRRRSRMNGSP